MKTRTEPYTTPQLTSSISFFDRFGMAISSLCALHCLILPLALPFMGAFAAMFDSEWTHVVLAALIIPTVLLTAWRGYKHHGKAEVIWLLGIGALTILLALVVGENGAGEFTEAAVTTVGSVLLITGHWQNHKHSALCLTGEPHKH